MESLWILAELGGEYRSCDHLLCCVREGFSLSWEGLRRKLEAQLGYLYNLLIFLWLYNFIFILIFNFIFIFNFIYLLKSFSFIFIVNIVSHDDVMHIPIFEIEF